MHFSARKIYRWGGEGVMGSFGFSVRIHTKRVLLLLPISASLGTATFGLLCSDEEREKRWLPTCWIVLPPKPVVHDATDTDLHGTKWQHLQSSFHNFQTIRVFFFWGVGWGGGVFNKQDQKLSEILLCGFFIFFISLLSVGPVMIFFFLFSSGWCHVIQ